MQPVAMWWHSNHVASILYAFRSWNRSTLPCTGLAINLVMVGDTLFVALVMLVGWRVRSLWVACFVLPILSLELLLLSSNASKVPKGRWWMQVCMYARARCPALICYAL